jgi:hypothetical protein
MLHMISAGKRSRCNSDVDILFAIVILRLDIILAVRRTRVCNRKVFRNLAFGSRKTVRCSLGRTAMLTLRCKVKG